MSLSATRPERFAVTGARHLLSLAIDLKRKTPSLWRTRSASWKISVLKTPDYKQPVLMLSNPKALHFHRTLWFVQWFLSIPYNEKGISLHSRRRPGAWYSLSANGLMTWRVPVSIRYQENQRCCHSCVGILKHLTTFAKADTVRHHLHSQTPGKGRSPHAIGYSVVHPECLWIVPKDWSSYADDVKKVNNAELRKLEDQYGVNMSWMNCPSVQHLHMLLSCSFSNSDQLQASSTLVWLELQSKSISGLSWNSWLASPVCSKEIPHILLVSGPCTQYKAFWWHKAVICPAKFVDCNSCLGRFCTWELAWLQGPKVWWSFAKDALSSHKPASQIQLR